MKYNYDYSKLRGLIREKLGTEREFARRIGRSIGYVSGVLNNLNQFSQTDIEKAIKILEIDPYDISLYFFTLKVCKSETSEVIA